MIFQIQSLGTNGRFGNMLWQLTLGICLARKYNTKVEIPEDWSCRPIFPFLPTEYITWGFPNGQSPIRTPVDYIPTQMDIDQYKSIDLYGYWQNQDTLDMTSRSELRSWFRFADWIYEMFPKGFQDESMRKDGYIACHSRRGDYATTVSHCYCCISDYSYERALGDLDSRIQEVDWISEEDPYKSITMDDLNLGFIPDFMRLVNSDVLLRANSTFSWWAGVFNNGKVYSPLVEDKVGWQDLINFVEGNWPKCASSKNHPSTKLTDLHLKD